MQMLQAQSEKLGTGGLGYTDQFYEGTTQKLDDATWLNINGMQKDEDRHNARMNFSYEVGNLWSNLPLGSEAQFAALQARISSELTTSKIDSNMAQKLLRGYVTGDNSDLNATGRLLFELGLRSQNDAEKFLSLKVGEQEKRLQIVKSAALRSAFAFANELEFDYLNRGGFGDRTASYLADIRPNFHSLKKTVIE
jgi:hypothetical protein